MEKEHEMYLDRLFLDKNIVFTASELIDKLRKGFSDCTKDNARKIIQNAIINGVIKSTNPIILGHNQYAYYGAVFDIQSDKIKNIIKENRPGFYRIINRMYENGGALSYLEAFELSGSLVQNTTTKVNMLAHLSKILEDLKIAEPKYERDSGIPYLVRYNMDESDAIHTITIILNHI